MEPDLAKRIGDVIASLLEVLEETREGPTVCKGYPKAVSDAEVLLDECRKGLL